jgi:glycosyltransferase involved in cell wall biosynthesis
MAMATPKISVCIPVRNGGAFLPSAVESILEQSFSDFELIIIDNCSTDGTVEWIEAKIAKAPNVRFYKNPTNLGLVGNFNACLARAQGHYVKFLCADDLLLPGCLQRMADALDADHTVTLAVGGRMLIDESGKRINTKRYADKDITVPGTEAINRCIFGKNYFGEPSAVMFRRSAAQRGFRETLPHLMDLEMWFHILEQGLMVSLADDVCAIRRHSAQMSWRAIETGALVDDNVTLFSDYGEKPYIRRTWSKLAIRRLRMAYRVWMCKNALNRDKRNQILAAHSYKLFYYTVMPVLASALSVWRKSGLLLRRQRQASAQ